MTQPGAGEDAGQLDITVVADLRGFATRLRREVNAAAAKVKAKVGVTVNATGLRTELRKAVKAASEKTKVKARIGVQIGVADFRRAVKEVAAKAKAQAKIGVAVSATQLRRAVKEASDKAAAKVRVDADTKPAERKLAALRRQARISFEANTSGLVSGIKRAVSAAAGLAGVAAKAGGIALLAAGAAAAASELIGLTAAILPAAQSIGLLPALLAAATAAVGTFKLATAGVGDAITETFKAYETLASGAKLTAAEQKKVEEALNRLSPAARSFVEELTKLYPAFDRLQLDLQERFFTGLGAAVAGLARTYLPTLRAGLGQISSEMNRGLLASLTRINTTANASKLQVFLANTASAAGLLFQALGPVADALLDLSAVGSGFLPSLAYGLNEAAEAFAEFIATAAADGSLQRFISDGLSTLGNLAEVGGDVIGILRGIFAAARTAGGDAAFGALGTLLDTLNEAANSAEGQQALIGFFTALNQVGAALSPVLGSLVSAIGTGLAPIIGDLAVALSPGLVVLIDALAEGLRLLAPAATPVGAALAEVARAVAPLLPLLGAQLANGLVIIAGALQALAVQGGPLIGLFADLGSQVLTMLLPVLTQLVAGGLGPAAEAGIALAQAFLPLIPALVTLAQTIAGQLMAHLPALQDVIGNQLLPAVVAAAEALAGGLLDAIVNLIPLLPDLVESGLQLAMAMLRLLTTVAPLLPILASAAAAMMSLFSGFGGGPAVLSPLIDALTFLITTSLNIPAAVGAAAAAVGGFFSSVWSAITTAGSAIGTFFTTTLPGWLSAAGAWFAGLPGQIGAALAALPGILVSSFWNALNTAAYAVGFGIGLIIGFFASLPGRAAAAWASLTGLIAAGVASVGAWFDTMRARVTTAVVDLWARARALFNAGVAAVSTFVSTLPERLAGYANTAKTRVLAAFSSLWSSARSAASNGAATVANFVKGIPDRIGNLGGRLVSAGKDLIRGLIDGVKSMASSLVSSVKGVVDRGIQGAKDALGIRSPSRVFMEIGQRVIQGYTVGIDKGQPAAARASQDLADATRGPFNAPSQVDGAATAGTGGPLVDSITLLAAPGTPVRDQLDDVMFNLRRIQRGGYLAG